MLYIDEFYDDLPWSNYKIKTVVNREQHCTVMFSRVYMLRHRCASAFNYRVTNGEELLEKTIRHSVSRAWRLGQAVLHARKVKSSPVQAILEHEGGTLICRGKVRYPDCSSL